MKDCRNEEGDDIGPPHYKEIEVISVLTHGLTETKK